MEAFNRTLFMWLNAGEHPPHIMLFLATAVAQWLIGGVALLLLALWLWGSRACRAAVLMAAQTAGLALCCNVLIGLCFMHPRPFMIPLGHTYLAHAAETSFPSDHAVVFFAVGLGLCTWRKALGGLLLALGALVGLARIYLGVHFPFDIAGSLVVAIACYWLVVAVLHAATLQRRLLDGLEALYRRLFAPAIERGWVCR